MNYSLSGEKYFDIKHYYLKAVVSIIFLAGLVIPAFFFFEIAVFFNLDSKWMQMIIGTVFLSAYFFLFFHFLKPVAESILNKKDKRLSAVFTGITNNIYSFSNNKKQLNWDTYFKDGIDLLCSELSINSASLFLHTSEPDFELIHEYGERSRIQLIPGKEKIIDAIKKYKQIIEKSLIYTDPELRMPGDELLKFFLKHDAEIAVPLFQGKNELTALLILGKNNERKLFPARDLIYFLDSYRLHLETLLGKILFSENVRKTQISKRDIMVVRNIKKRIIPGRFNNIKGLKISSIFIDNSEFGGDYLNTMKMNENKAGIFLCNVSDMGIESILLSLQIHSVFRSQAEYYESPEIIMNNINQVLCSSGFTDKYATSIYIIYDSSSREIAFSNAAFNSLLIYDPGKESFDEYDAEGIPLGIDIGFRYKHRTVFAPVNSIGLLYSNGLSSAFNKQGNSYSPSRLKDIIMINKDDEPAEIVKKIYNDFKSFIDDNILLNDVSIILFRMQ
ncbi:MAG: serine/threonine-protein phosphatase [Spirochaetes bacterium]|nr:serine/threonine-protein phosphatase [Spirochaetota bacterium]